MTTKTYKWGKFTGKAYKKPAGNGWEVGFTTGTQAIFVGNFIHAKEATAWWTLMNQNLRKFSKRYAPTPTTPTAWYRKFLSNYVYKAYYTFLEREFTKYHRGYKKAVAQDTRRFSNFQKAWAKPTHHYSSRRAA